MYKSNRTIWTLFSGNATYWYLLSWTKRDFLVVLKNFFFCLCFVVILIIGILQYNTNSNWSQRQNSKHKLHNNHIPWIYKSLAFHSCAYHWYSTSRDWDMAFLNLVLKSKILWKYQWQNQCKYMKFYVQHNNSFYTMKIQYHSLNFRLSEEKLPFSIKRYGVIEFAV